MSHKRRNETEQRFQQRLLRNREEDAQVARIVSNINTNGTSSRARIDTIVNNQINGIRTRLIRLLNNIRNAISFVNANDIRTLLSNAQLNAARTRLYNTLQNADELLNELEALVINITVTESGARVRRQTFTNFINEGYTIVQNGLRILNAFDYELRIRNAY
jgi:hypothetical protein